MAERLIFQVTFSIPIFSADKVDFKADNFTSHRYASNGTRTISGGIVIEGVYSA